MDATQLYVAALKHSIQAERAMGRCIVARLEAGQEIASLFTDGREHRTNRGAGDLILLSKVSHRRTLAALRALRTNAPELVAA
jgi:hypothetical protein